MSARRRMQFWRSVGLKKLLNDRGPGPDFQFEHDDPQERLYSIRADVQPGGDPFARKSLGQAFDHLALALGQVELLSYMDGVDVESRVFHHT